MFFYDDIFTEIELDLLDFKSKYNHPICIIGDLNSHTNPLNDIPECGDFLAKEVGCDWLATSNCLQEITNNASFTYHRYNQDLSCANSNGKQLIELCQAFDMCIANGRIGQDKFVGHPTCHKGAASVVDYAVTNDAMIPFCADFNVKILDKCISDVHCPVSLQLIVPQHIKLENKSTELKNDDCGKNYQNQNLTWSPSIADVFFNSISDPKIEQLENDLESMQKHTTQSNIDKLCSDMSNIIIDAAKGSGAYKELKQGTSERKKYISKQRPWFDQECIEERKKYYKVKNILKRKGKRSMCNKESKKF